MTPFVILIVIIAFALVSVAIYRAVHSPDVPTQISDQDETVPSARPLTAISIFWAIFGALWAYTLLASLVYIALRSLNNL